MKIITKNFKDNINEVYHEFLKDSPYIVGTDTETDGLDQRNNKPFMIIFGWLKPGEFLKSYTFYITKENKEFYKKMINDKNIKYHFMWNMKFDIGMLKNIDIDLYPLENLYEGMTIPRLLFNFYDKRVSLALKKFSESYLEQNSKFLQDKVITELNMLIKNVEYKKARLLKEKTNWTLGELKKYKKDIFLEDKIPKNVLDIWEKINLENPLPTYKDISKDLIEEYGANDVVLMLLIVNKFFGSLINKDSPNYQLETVIRESNFAKALSIIEKNGMAIDKNYLMNSKIELEKLIKMWYNELWELLKMKINVGQHKELITWFHNNGTPLYNRKNHKIFDAQDDTLLYCVENLEKINAKDKIKQKNTIRICELIRKLRSFTKWYTTYLTKYLEDLIEIDNKYYIFGSINSFGTQTGRVSSSWQQFPRESLTNCFCEQDNKCFIKEHIVFSPRKMFIPRYENGYLGFLDYSQMELRVAAEQTLKIGVPDKSWLNAYFNYENKENWQPYDIHTDSAEKIFGINDKTEQHIYKDLRGKAKQSNFTILYGGSAKAINNRAYKGNNLKEAENFYNKFKRTYPGIITFQNWCAERVLNDGRLINDFGRIYRWKEPDWKSTREAGSCMIQGACADFVKDRIIAVQKYLFETNSKIKIVNSIHDEIILDIPKEELYKINEIKKIMETQKIWKTPLICDVNLSKTNWADKE